MESASHGRPRDLGTLLLNSMIAVVFLCALAIFALYTNPPEHLIIPQHEMAVRVTRVDALPVGSSRIITWGEQAILVVRRTETEYAALQGTSPIDGCILEWDADALRVTSPCTHQLYNLRGHAVEGLTTEPLQRYRVYVRNGIVYVTRD
jgi:nitrite reductase/ring-hydroxylating ferredoxin subunit